MKRITNKSSGLLRCACFMCALFISIAVTLESFAETYTINYTLNYTHDYNLVSSPGVAGIAPAESQLECLSENDGINMYGQPLKKVMFQIPIDAKDVRINVTSKHVDRVIKLDSPLKEHFYYTNNGKRISNSDTDSIGVFFDGQEAIIARIISDIVIGMNMRIVGAVISPTDYNPGDLTITGFDKVDLGVTVDKTEHEIPDTDLDKWKPRSTLEAAFNPCVINGVKRWEPFFVSSSHYYIITPSSLKPSLERLARWKRQKGYNVTVKSIEDIRKNPKYALEPQNGIVDDAERLRTYLLDEYMKIHAPNDGNARDMFCLIVGDYYTGMPIRRLQSEIDTVFDIKNHVFQKEEFYTNWFVPTDNYFSDLTTDLGLHPLKNYWPESMIDNKGIYSANIPKENVYNPAIAVGRLLCRTPQDVENYIEKLILYESYPGMGDMEYLNHAYAFQHYQMARAYEAEGVFKEMDFISDSNKTITNEFDFEQCIENYESGIYDKPAEPTATEVIQQMKGNGFLSWHGHGRPGSITVSGHRRGVINRIFENKFNDECQYDTTYKDYGIKALSGYSWHERGIEAEPGQKDGLDALSNQNYPAVAYSVACTIIPMGPLSGLINNGEQQVFQFLDEPDVDMGRSYTCYGKYGGPALIANTREGAVRYSDKLEQEFIKALKNCRKIGIAAALSKVKYCAYDSITRHVMTTASLIGDPEMDVWLGEPDRLCVNILHGESNVHLFGDDLRGASVTLYDGHDVLSSQKMIESSASISLPNDAYGNALLVSVWKPGYLPVQRIIFRKTGISQQTIFDTVNLSFVENKDNHQLTLCSGNDITVNMVSDDKITNDFIIQPDASLNINGNNLYITSGVTGGGNILLSGKTLTFEPGFEITKETTLFTSNNRN